MAKGKPSLRVAAVTIACMDLARSVKFYEQVLGAVREEGDGNGVCPWFKLGPISISLLCNATEASPANFPDHPMAMLWLETDDLAAVAKRFDKFKINVLEPSNGDFMIVSDPDGIIIEVWQT